MAKTAKSVSWAPGLKLYQVRLFLSEDAPVLSSLDAQDNLQAKTSRLWHSAVGFDDSLPPGFESFNQSNQLKIDFSQIPLIQWKHPLQFDLNPDWLLVAGEESNEVRFQNQRQLGVLEAIYPRASSIPANPSVSPEALDSRYDDSCTALVPITPVEDEDSDPTIDPILPFNTSVPVSLPVQSATPANYEPHKPSVNFTVAPQASTSMPGVEPDVAAAATLAFTAIMSSGGKDSLVDQELLIKLLTDPKLVEKLATEYRAPPSQGSTPHHNTMPVTSQFPPRQQFNVPQSTSVLGRLNVPEFVASNAVNPPITEARSVRDTNSIGAMRAGGGVRDMTYYKSLIEQHGGENRATWDPNLLGQVGNQHVDDGERVIHGLNQRDSKFSTPKPPCVYFNTPRGCKRGASCLYLHDTSLPPVIDRRNPKRIKSDREIAGRN